MVEVKMFSSELFAHFVFLHMLSLSQLSRAYLLCFLFDVELFPEFFFFIRSCKFAFIYKGYLNQGTGWFQLILPQFLFFFCFVFFGPVLTENKKNKSTPLRSGPGLCNFILQISFTEYVKSPCHGVIMAAQLLRMVLAFKFKL